MTAVGMIGIGEMGSAMTARLLECGVPVVGYDPDDARAAQAEELGATLADSPGDVARKTDGPLLLNVQTLDQAYCAWRYGDGLIDAVDGRTVVVTGTFGEVPVQRFAGELAAHGADVLDAPHTGSYPAARSGTLTFFLGGSPAAREAAQIAIGNLGSNLHVIGDRPGQGQVMKLVNAIGLAFNAASICEMEKIAEASGIDPGQAIRWIDECSGSSWLSLRMPDIGKLMVEHNIDNLEKDLRAVLEPCAATTGQLPVTAAILDSIRTSWLTRPF